MKIIAMIPYWSEYAFPNGSIEARDTVKLAGKSLINYTVEMVSHINAVDELVIYSSNSSIMDEINNKSICQYLKREPFLDSKETSIERVIESFVSQKNADIIVLLHPKLPFLHHSTVSKCIDAVLSGEY